MTLADPGVRPSRPGADDAAGLLVQGARPVHNPLDLIEAWTGHDDVVVVDAVVSGAPAGTVFEWDALAAPLPAEEFRCSTHSYGVAEAVDWRACWEDFRRSLP